MLPVFPLCQYRARENGPSASQIGLPWILHASAPRLTLWRPLRCGAAGKQVGGPVIEVNRPAEDLARALRLADERVELPPGGRDVGPLEVGRADREVTPDRRGPTFRRGEGPAAGQLPAVDAVVRRVGRAEIAEVERPVAVLGLTPPVGQQAEVLAPVEVRIAQQPDPAARAAGREVEEGNIIR